MDETGSCGMGKRGKQRSRSGPRRFTSCYGGDRKERKFAWADIGVAIDGYPLSWRAWSVNAGQVHKPPASTRSSWIAINTHHAGAGHGARGLAAEAARPARYRSGGHGRGRTCPGRGTGPLPYCRRAKLLAISASRPTMPSCPRIEPGPVGSCFCRRPAATTFALSGSRCTVHCWLLLLWQGMTRDALCMARLDPFNTTLPNCHT